MNSNKTEFDIFKNFYTDEKRKRYRSEVNNLSLQSKNDSVSERLRQLSNAHFAAKEYSDCLSRYTESLRNATCNGRQYALALANRSATYFAMKKYQNSLIDINLCLQADYPIRLKPKLLIRKAKCFIKMGNYNKMVETIDNCCKEMEDYADLPKIDKDNYLKEIKSLVDIKQVNIEDLLLEEIALGPEVILEQNKLNPNVSASIQLKYNSRTGTDYVAARDIPLGEVLFIDTSYAIGTSLKYEEDYARPFVCDYCCNEAPNCIPCKICINLVYCTENCRNNSWTECHQWECDLFRSQLMGEDTWLPYRTLIKAAFSGEIFQIKSNAKPCKPCKNRNPYLNIYNLPVDLASFRSKCTEMFIDCCEQVVIMIEYLKKANFFTILISTASCQKDYPTLVNFVGGLLIKHVIQLQQRSLIINDPIIILPVNDFYEKLTVLGTQDTNTIKQLVLQLSKKPKFHVFCPIVSGVKYSCDSNTSMYFNGNTCIVKPCKNLKAGDCIFRSGYNFTPRHSLLARLKSLQDMDINCDCKACEDINNNMEILDTYVCVVCGTFTVYRPTVLSFMVCTNCKRTTSIDAIESMIDYACVVTEMRERIHFDNPDLKKALTRLNVLQKFVNPYHGLMFMHYNQLLRLYLKQANIEGYKETLQKVKTCTENRNRKYDAFEYILDLFIISKDGFAFLELHKSKLHKREIMEMLNYCSDLVKEAKEIAEFTSRPLLRIFATIEFDILRFRLKTSIKDL